MSGPLFDFPGTDFVTCNMCENGMILVNGDGIICDLPFIDWCDTYSETINDECEVCQPGYTLVESNKRLCHPCELDGCLQCSFITVNDETYQTCHYCDKHYTLYNRYLDEYNTMPQGVCNF